MEKSWVNNNNAKLWVVNSHHSRITSSTIKKKGEEKENSDHTLPHRYKYGVLVHELQSVKRKQEDLIFVK